MMNLLFSSSGHSRSLQFSGSLHITSKGFEQDAAPLLGEAYNSLETLVKTQTPDNTVVFLNVHNTNKALENTPEAARAFCSSAKGAKSIQDLMVNIKVKGDRSRTCFGIDGELLGQWLSRLQKHFASAASQEKPALTGIEASFQKNHDTPWDKLPSKHAQQQFNTGIALSDRIRYKAARHLRSKWTSKRSKTISGTLLRVLCPDVSNNSHTNGNIDISKRAIHLAANYLRTLSPRNPAKALSGALLCHLKSTTKGDA
jgi:hypothetical protein